MAYPGPVGSLVTPETPSRFEQFAGDGFTLFIERDLVPQVPGSLRFHFGAFGWCRADLHDGRKKY